MVANVRVLAGGFAAALLLVALGACGKESLTKPDLIDPTKTGDAFEGVQCTSIRPPTEPDLMGWDAGSRAKLKSLHEEGVVAVRYKAEGCNVELELLNCVGEEQYSFSAYSASETKTAKSQQELYTKLPIGAAEFGGKVGGGQALRTDYLMAGMKKLGVMKSYPAGKLRGNCDQATHVVSTLYIGGFAMAAGESDTLGASATVFGAGGELSSDRSAERLVVEGSAEACAEAQSKGTEVPQCSVPLRVGLTPIEGRAEGSCPRGASWNGEACVKKEVVTEVSCPSGTTLSDGKCVGAVDESCPSGTRFVKGQGCVAKVAPLPSPANTASSSAGRAKKRLTKDDVSQVLRASVARVAKCTVDRKGGLVIRFFIERTGRVSEAKIDTASFEGTRAGRCALDVVRSLQFPTHDGERAPVKYPFVLR